MKHTARLSTLILAALLLLASALTAVRANCCSAECYVGPKKGTPAMRPVVQLCADGTEPTFFGFCGVGGCNVVGYVPTWRDGQWVHLVCVLTRRVWAECGPCQ